MRTRWCGWRTLARVPCNVNWPAWKLAGLLTVRQVGNQKHFQANRDCPFYPELRSMVVKTFGALALLRDLFASLDADVECAFLFGGGADELPGPGEVLELFVISQNLQRRALEKALVKVSSELGHDFQLTLVRPTRFRELLEASDERLKAILAQPRLVLHGSCMAIDYA